jgi:superfamily I DNA/RNA helicase
MKLSDLSANKDYKISNLECRLIRDENLLTKEGKVTLSAGGELRFEAGDRIYRFTVDQEAEKLLIYDRFKQGNANLARIVIGKNNDPVFFLEIVFFPRSENFGKLEIVIGDKITDSLIQKKVFSGDIRDNSLTDMFVMSDGYKKCFAYSTGYVPDEILNKTEEIEKTEDGNDSTDETELDDEATKKEENKNKTLILYGKDLTLYISLRRSGLNDVAVAEKVIVRKTKNTPPMFLGYGELAFVREASYVSGMVKGILSESSEYLGVWNQYTNLEGESLFKHARKIGIINHIPPVLDRNGYLIQFTNPGSIANLNKGDYLMFSEQIPMYIEDPDLSWDEYRLKTEEINPITGKKLYRLSAHLAEITEIDVTTNSVVIKGEHPPVMPYLSFSINGDAEQIKRREDSRKKITDGLCEMPTLGLILEGKGAANINDVAVTRVINHISPMSAHLADRKVFRNNPTDTQLSAVEIALNTPDIAIIQGPPGTGKTTVITAIIERLNELMDKRESIKGEVLITCFQHDAVENVISRLRINSLPTVKFGRRSGQNEEDDIYGIEKIIDEWCSETIERIREKHAAINEAGEISGFEKAFRFYEMSPGESTAIAFLQSARKLTLSNELIETCDEIMNSFGVNNSGREDILKFVYRLRLSEKGFMDDGSDNAMALYDELEKMLDKNDSEQRRMLEILKKAALTEERPSKQLLEELGGLRTLLIEKLSPKSVYKTEKPRSDIIELYGIIKDSLKKPRNEVDGIILDFLSELENNQEYVRKALADYNFVYSATTQKTAGKEIWSAKNKNVSYDTVIVDEAARANPGDLMIPLTQARRRIILVGDHRQLPHIFDDEIIEMLKEENDNFNYENIKITMFEQLWKSAEKLELNDGIKRTITLDAQYRMHPLLGNFVCENFYKIHGEFFVSPLEAGFFSQGFYNSPCVWIDVKNNNEIEKKDGTSRRRDAEVKVIATRIKEMMDTKEGKKLSFGIISFYSAQVTEIRRKLDKDIRDRVRVGSVDAFQGMEFDVIFLSVVRTRKNMPERLPEEHDLKYAEQFYGFMTSPNRLCVAMSRQKRLLIVVGDSNMFVNEIAAEYVPAMKKFYEMCRENGGVLND